MRNDSSGDDRVAEPQQQMRWRRLAIFCVQFAMDGLAWVVALTVALIARYEFDVPSHSWLPLVGVMVWAVLLQLIFGWATFLYRGRFYQGAFNEVRTVALSALGTGLLIFFPVIFFHDWFTVPRSIGLTATPIALILMFAIRYLRRLYIEFRVGPGARSVPTLIYGAGYLGARITRRLKTDRASSYWPVGLIDDSTEKRNVEFDRVRVKGPLDQIDRLVAETDAKAIVVAIAQPSPGLMRRVQDAATRLDLEVKVLPPVEEMLARRGDVQTTDLRDLAIEDLLGRAPLDTNVENVAGYLAGKRVLVTGAGGSIGSELCAQIAKFRPSELTMLDRDETGLQQVQLTVDGHGLLDTRDVVLADIRDGESIKTIFKERRPEVVFHAAALKHLPMLEQYPDEGWKVNVLGTLNVLEAAREVDVTTFINVSTDKAASPTSVLGHSKRTAEKLTAGMGEATGRKYISVRFGNVIGSRGSMLPTFTRLIEQGGPLTVTHPDVTRFFMTIPEACQLVIQAGGIGSTGEVLILDMGEPVRILDIAERMIAMSGRKDVEITFTGLRPGEKLHEILVSEKEAPARPFHPKISHAPVEPIARDALSYDSWLENLSARESARNLPDIASTKVERNS